MFRDPFDFLDDKRLTSWLTSAVAITATLMVVIYYLDAYLQDALISPNGIVSFELAGTTSAAQAMLDNWGPRGKLYASFILGIDYAFLAAYSTSLALGLSRFARGREERIARWVFVLCYAQWVAAALDMIENLALFQVLRGLVETKWVLIAQTCAVGKFTLVALGLAGVAGLGIWRLLAPPDAPEDEKAT